MSLARVEAIERASRLLYEQGWRPSSSSVDWDAPTEQMRAKVRAVISAAFDAALPLLVRPENEVKAEALEEARDDWDADDSDPDDPMYGFLTRRAEALRSGGGS